MKDLSRLCNTTVYPADVETWFAPPAPPLYDDIHGDNVISLAVS